MHYYAIIVAGGSGKRMQADLPKQFHLLLGKPVMMHTIEAFYHSSYQPEILIVLNTDYISYWKDLCVQHNFFIPHTIIPGGAQRFDSVKNAVQAITNEDSIIAVHDAVRPVIHEELIARCFDEATVKEAVIPVIPSKDSLRKINGSTTVSISRDDILIVQTPQVFKYKVLKKAYNQLYSQLFTDDASVVEHAGYTIFTTQGHASNIKITYIEDLAVASLFLSSKA
ncbi:2-C-methyl-D-erythritol 4-phosphate cytidylyltransferase [Arcticibacter svalbardensis MN12-7]|uniref:2-C-methyl-D-erythritol 4-phosphate cytidylyltransferase n=1 Tax=Arcticibacter svalbardensis MN12-7 TaxID=1150600 RepID=R9GVB9_9SPHI|nr:2-C-methyl-D-erythritol 4-phosphate cytidylyltransferase [Arcticibacter svalbardensis]EOR95646.1 2-C-methyl-D-erythritol 4-phosphate cytidylyltransferase [Arcticibacter svalbardensis MN12-7]